MIKRRQNFKRGFGLLEVLISVVILVTIMGSMVTVGQTALGSTGQLQMRAQAYYLAQEGIEAVRQIRDTNWIDGDNTTGWNSLVFDGTKLVVPQINTGYTLLSAANGSYRLVAEQNEPIAVGSASFVRTVNIKLPSNLIPSNGTPSINPADGSNAIIVSVTVGWQNAGKNYSVTSEELLTNWRPQF